jgi:hypothetical protein
MRKMVVVEKEKEREAAAERTNQIWLSSPKNEKL